jgi:uncharacterized protein YecE (DUF72 family)
VAAPAGFEFVLKGSQFITHRLKLEDAAGAVDRFFTPLDPVLPRTTVVLWQLPPRWKRNIERLDAFLAGLPEGYRYAVEFRDEDWFHPATYEVLDAHGAAHVWLSSSLTGATSSSRPATTSTSASTGCPRTPTATPTPRRSCGPGRSGCARSLRRADRRGSSSTTTTRATPYATPGP